MYELEEIDVVILKKDKGEGEFGNYLQIQKGVYKHEKANMLNKN